MRADHKAIRTGKEHIAADFVVLDRVENALDRDGLPRHKVDQVRALRRHMQVDDLTVPHVERRERVERIGTAGG